MTRFDNELPLDEPKMATRRKESRSQRSGAQYEKIGTFKQEILNKMVNIQEHVMYFWKRQGNQLILRCKQCEEGLIRESNASKSSQSSSNA